MLRSAPLRSLSLALALILSTRSVLATTPAFAAGLAWRASGPLTRAAVDRPEAQAQVAADLKRAEIADAVQAEQLTSLTARLERQERLDAGSRLAVAEAALRQIDWLTRTGYALLLTLAANLALSIAHLRGARRRQAEGRAPRSRR